jgi:hypothetical protein
MRHRVNGNLIARAANKRAGGAGPRAQTVGDVNVGPTSVRFGYRAVARLAGSPTARRRMSRNVR